MHPYEFIMVLIENEDNPYIYDLNSLGHLL